MAEFLQLFITGLIVGSLYALVAVAIVLVFKATQIVSLAHAQILAFGALALWVSYVGFGFPLWLGLLIALAFVALLGFVAERVFLRPLIGQPTFAAFMMCFAIFMVMDGFFQLILKGETRTYPPFLPAGILEIGGTTVPSGGLVTASIALLVFVLLILFFRFTKVGLGMRATAEDHQLAQSTGISVKRVFSLVWIMSAVAAGVAGIALATVMDIHYPLPWIGVKGLIVALFGGMDSLLGALVAGLLIGVLENLGAGYLDPYVGGGIKEVFAYVMLLFILLVRPYGLFGQVRIERV